MTQYLKEYSKIIKKVSNVDAILYTYYYDYLFIEQETLCKDAILQFQSIAAAVAKAVHNKFTFTDNLFQ